MVLLIAMVILVSESGTSKLPLGYVDQASILNLSLQSNLPKPEERVKIQAYPDEKAALAALEGNEIQAFFVLPPDYLQTLHTGLYYLEKPPSEDVWGQFDDFVRMNLIAALPEVERERVFSGPEITVVDITSNRKFSTSNIINIIIPFAASFFFFIVTMSTSGYMLRVVGDEKENRTMEIMVTSLTPFQLIGGKALGLLAASLTQILVYLVTAVVGLKIAAPYVAVLQQAEVPWTYLGVMALFFFPAFALIAAIMVAIGGAVGEIQQGQQVAGLLNLVFMLPIFLTMLLFENPSHPLILLMTFFPATAFLTISLRWGLSTIPVWQLGLSWVLLVTTTAAMMWAAAHIFRAGMLHYGQPLNIRAVWAALKVQ
jgi:ABC-2 type transport system permease protein